MKNSNNDIAYVRPPDGIIIITKKQCVSFLINTYSMTFMYLILKWRI